MSLTSRAVQPREGREDRPSNGDLTPEAVETTTRGLGDSKRIISFAEEFTRCMKERKKEKIREREERKMRRQRQRNTDAAKRRITPGDIEELGDKLRDNYIARLNIK
jgi:hypothetical protein